MVAARDRPDPLLSSSGAFDSAWMKTTTQGHKYSTSNNLNP